MKNSGNVSYHSYEILDGQFQFPRPDMLLVAENINSDLAFYGAVNTVN